jgi:sodium-dependent phosphate cotransporter
MSTDDKFVVDEKDTADVKSRKDRPTGSTHFGDTDFNQEQTEEIGGATWGEVFNSCCVHSGKEWGMIFLGVVAVFFFLYFFLLGLNVLGTAAKIIGGCTAGALFDDDANPVAGLMIGILCTVLIQSSSSTTSIIVSLVGADVIEVKAGIFMVMGANIGTSVTNTIVAMGHMGDGDELERAFAGATVHDMFNFLTVSVLFPIELITGMLFHLTKAMLPSSNRAGEGEKWEGPIKKLVGPFGQLIIIANKDIPKFVAQGEDKKGNPVDGCSTFYPVVCEDNDNPTRSTCSRGLIDCDKKTDKCPAFFQPDATQKDDVTSGAVCFVLGLVILCVCLIGLVTVLQKGLMGVSTRIIYKATNMNGYLAILIGTGLTILVQSSSITTSVLTPIVGIGALRLEQMLPLTLGANIGTTATGILASLVSDGVNALHVALCHFFFNIIGIIIWYPLPFLRQIPVNAARNLGKATRIWRGFPILYILTIFFVTPAALFGVFTLFDQDSKGFTVLGAFIVVALGLLLIFTLYKWFFGGLKESTTTCFGSMQARRDAVRGLPEDMSFIKSELERLKEHTGLADAKTSDSDIESNV